jgi:hypothetical protein
MNKTNHAIKNVTASGPKYDFIMYLSSVFNCCKDNRANYKEGNNLKNLKKIPKKKELLTP